MESLGSGLAALGLQASPARVDQLSAYLALLAKWNRAYNLSAVREPGEMVTRHVLDSLSVLPYVHGTRMLDIGSGAGLPGVPIAILRPDLEVVLLDSNGKKARFLRQAKLELGLDNIEVAEARVERYSPPSPFDTVISRAFAEARVFFASATPLLAPGGRILAMKGRLNENEVAQISAESGKLVRHTLKVPGLGAERHLLQLEPYS